MRIIELGVLFMCEIYTHTHTHGRVRAHTHSVTHAQTHLHTNTYHTQNMFRVED